MKPARVSILLRVAYVVIIGFATLAEPHVQIVRHTLGMRLEGAIEPGLSGRDLVDAVRNVLLFAGWGAVWLMTAPRGPARPVLLRATLSGALLSVSVEAFQLMVPTRTPSVVDLLTNTAGAFLGALVAAAMVLFVRAGRGERSFVGVPIATFAGAYGGAVLLDAFSPLFRQDRVPGAWGSPIARFTQAVQALEWSSVLHVQPSEILLVAPAALFAVAALVEMGMSYDTAWPRVAAVGAAALGLTELARGAAGYVIALGPIVAGGLGMLLGAWAATRLLPAFSRKWRGSARPRLLWWLYVALLMLWALRPFYPEFDVGMLAQKLSLERLIPLLSYRERVDIFTAVDVGVTGLLVLPAGALLAVWPLRRRGWLAGPLPVVYLAVVAECTQVFVAGRWFDATDLLVEAAAALLGWAMVRRAGFRPYGEALRPARSGSAGS
ncbi:MAG: VanZ family protein [Gemmatimonadota bacterium]|jgi:VanZ family protein